MAGDLEAGAPEVSITNVHTRSTANHWLRKLELCVLGWVVLGCLNSWPVGSWRSQRSWRFRLWTIRYQSKWRSLFRNRRMDHVDRRMGSLLQLDRYLVGLQLHDSNASTSDCDDNNHLQRPSGRHHGHDFWYSSRQFIDLRHNG